MLEQLTILYTNLLSMTKENPVIGGIVSLWGLGIVTYLCRDIPKVLWKFISRQLTTSLSFNNTGDDSNLIVFNLFNEWFIQRKGAQFSRSIALSRLCWFESFDKQNGRIGAGYGWHLFIYNGRLFWFKKTRVESGSGNQIREEIVLFTFGRSHEVFIRLITAFVPQKKDNQLSIYAFDGKDWDFMCHTKKRNIETVITHNEIKEKIIKTLDDFFANKEWYELRGFNYKQTYMLYGPPGTGKSSLVKAISTHFNRNIYQLSLASLSNDRFEKAIRRLPKGSICLIEDFDDSSAVHARSGVSTTYNEDLIVEDKKENNNTEVNSLSDIFERLTLSTILNTLDGVADIDDVVIFMTTNCIEKIDPALLRKGRVDYQFYIGLLEDEDIRQYIRMIFSDEVYIPTTFVFNPISGCDLAALLKEHKFNVNNFIEAIPKTYRGTIGQSTKEYLGSCSSA